MPDANGAPTLCVESVSKRFDLRSSFGRVIGTVDAVTDVSLTIGAGETLGLVGESGCGKTTLARMIAALERPTAGAIRFGDEDVFTSDRRAGRRLRRRVQYMFQDPQASLDPRVRVGASVMEPLDVHRLGDRVERRRRVDSLLQDVGLGADVFDRYPHEFSGGQRQRIGFARALALEPDLIVADEPVSALDVSIRSQIINLMNRVQAARGLSFLLISHDLSVVRHLADRVGVMYLGRLVEVGATGDVFARPSHPYTRALLDVIPTADPVVERAKRRVQIKGELPSPIAPPPGCRFHPRCPRATDECRTVVPPLRRVGDHHVACHHPISEADAA